MKRSKPHRSSEKTKSFATNLSLTIVSVGVLLALIVVANRWQSREEVRGYQFEGLVVLEKDELVSLADLSEGVSVKEVDLDELEKRFRSHPFVEQVSVWYKGDGILKVNVVERKPVAFLILDGEPTYVDRYGIELPFLFGRAAGDVPLVCSLHGEMRLDSLQVHRAIGVIQKLKDRYPDAYNKIAELGVEENDTYQLRLTDGGLIVKAGTERELMNGIPRLNLFYYQVLRVDGAASFSSLDIRWDGQVVTRPKRVSTASLQS